jgi:hypothetical protein
MFTSRKKSNGISTLLSDERNRERNDGTKTMPNS